jgi:putative transposase
MRKEYIPLTDEIAIDLGLRPLIATDKGDLVEDFLMY